jgi:hypothetical protein
MLSCYHQHKQFWNSAGLEERLFEELRWGFDHLLASHEQDVLTGPARQTLRVYVQVGDTIEDTRSGKWTRPEQMDWERPVSYVDGARQGTDVTCEMAAALAAGFLVFKDTDPTYATRLIQDADTLFRFAHDRDESEWQTYQSVGFDDSCTSSVGCGVAPPCARECAGLFGNCRKAVFEAPD